VLINDILELSSIEAGGKEVLPSQFDVGEAVSEVREAG